MPQTPLHNQSTCPSIQPSIDPAVISALILPSASPLLTCYSVHLSPVHPLIHRSVSPTSQPSARNHLFSPTVHLHKLHPTPVIYISPITHPLTQAPFLSTILPHPNTIHHPLALLPQSTPLHPSIHHPPLPNTLALPNRTRLILQPPPLNSCAFLRSLTTPHPSVPPPRPPSARTLRHSPCTRYQPLPICSQALAPHSPSASIHGAFGPGGRRALHGRVDTQPQ